MIQFDTIAPQHCFLVDLWWATDLDPYSFERPKALYWGTDPEKTTGYICLPNDRLEYRMLGCNGGDKNSMHCWEPYTITLNVWRRLTGHLYFSASTSDFDGT
jgi:hypothetical protein